MARWRGLPRRPGPLARASPSSETTDGTYVLASARVAPASRKQLPRVIPSSVERKAASFASVPVHIAFVLNFAALRHTLALPIPPPM